MKSPLVAGLLLFLFTARLSAQDATPAPTARDAGPAVETIVLFRHGEKPADDKGQLNCQGLNRALALPDVLLPKYGKPNFLFAPATTKRGMSSHGEYSYIRPLMTIEPTAIRVDLPVETKFAYDDISGLQAELTLPSYSRAVIFIAWEHNMLDDLTKHLISSLGGDSDVVPVWANNDYDSIFVVRIRAEQGKRSVSFTHDQEGLNGLSTDCPEPRKSEAP